MLRRKLGGGSKRSKLALDGVRIPFGIEGNVRVVTELIVDFPSFTLGLDFILHYGRLCKQAKEAQLGQTAEARGLAGESVKPRCGNYMLAVAAVRQGHPNIDVREIGFH